MPAALNASIPDEPRSQRHLLLGSIVMLAITIIAYVPVMSDGGFIWDDDSYVTHNRFLQQGWHGLVQMWIPRQTPQYYPVAFTTFWIENQLWGLNPAGYHVVNVLIHALNALLVWRLARFLKLPWPWLVGAVFAVHPVHVESVAWITERKNTLSAGFYLLAALAYLRFDDDQQHGLAGIVRGESDSRWLFYAVSFVCLVAALLSKSVTCSLPAALLLMMLWQRKRLTVARLAPLLPFFAVGLVLALNTAHIEKVHVGATGEGFEYSVADRFLIATRALLFYPWKIIWPWPVMFVYPRWHIDDHDLRQYWSLAAVALIAAAALIAYMRGWRGPALALAFFAGTIVPALGFVNVYPMIFSFVADHFQYLASLGIIALLVGALASVLKTPQRMVISAAIVLPVLAAMTWIQSMTYHNAETVWRDTLSKNEAAFMPHNNLATELLRRAETALEAGRPDVSKSLALEADENLTRALELKPRYGQALSNLADLRRMQGRYEEGLQYAQQALGLVLSKPEVQAAIARGEHTWSPVLGESHWAVGRLQELLGHNDEALASYRESLAWNPSDAVVQAELPRLLMKLNREDEAAPEYEALLRLDPASVDALTTLGGIRQKQGRNVEARDLYTRAVAAAGDSDRDRLPALMRLVRLLATCPDAQVRDTHQAVRLMENLVRETGGQDPSVLDVLASTLAEDGRLGEAANVAGQAAALADRLAMPDLAAQIRVRLEQYRARLHPPSPVAGPATAPR